MCTGGYIGIQEDTQSHFQLSCCASIEEINYQASDIKHLAYKHIRVEHAYKFRWMLINKTQFQSSVIVKSGHEYGKAHL